ncbi:uncharacterized protein LOC141856104 [Brevipalpus obovatus]|uniref:uncharacterized protein LOC141856104 n=1 Tax=Brevipalpus obovatus TaxID=246614 RepID=UPI003D9F48FF
MALIIKYIQLLILPVMVCHCFWNPFARWSRQVNCGYQMPSYYTQPSQCNYQMFARPNPWAGPSYSTMDNTLGDGYGYPGQSAPFRPFMMGQPYYHRPAYFPYYYNRNQGGHSKSWPSVSLNPIVQQHQQPSLPGKVSVPDQQYKIKSYR